MSTLIPGRTFVAPGNRLLMKYLFDPDVFLSRPEILPVWQV